MITLKYGESIKLVRNGNVEIKSFNKVEVDYIVDYLIEKYNSKSYRLNDYRLEITHPNINLSDSMFNLKLDLLNCGKYKPDNNIIQYLEQLCTGIYTTYYQNN